MEKYYKKSPSFKAAEPVSPEDEEFAVFLKVDTVIPEPLVSDKAEVSNMKRTLDELFYAGLMTEWQQAGADYQLANHLYQECVGQWNEATSALASSEYEMIQARDMHDFENAPKWHRLVTHLKLRLTQPPRAMEDDSMSSSSWSSS